MTAPPRLRRLVERFGLDAVMFSSARAREADERDREIQRLREEVGELRTTVARLEASAPRGDRP